MISWFQNNWTLISSGGPSTLGADPHVSQPKSAVYSCLCLRAGPFVGSVENNGWISRRDEYTKKHGRLRQTKSGEQLEASA